MNDSIEQFFERERESVPLLAAPAGRFEQLQSGARRRRNRNTTAVSAAAVVVLAVAGTGVALNAHGGGTSRGAVAPAASTSLLPSSAAPTSTTPPVDPAVPSGFKAWSVSFVRGGVQGYALGGYHCTGGNECFAVLETTDSMGTWHTIAKPGFAAEFGMDGRTSILRFAGDGTDGWMVGSQGVWSTHDGGRVWRPIAALQDQQVDALEAWGSHTYAVGRGDDAIWVSSDSGDDGSWTKQTQIGLPSDSGATDTLQADDAMVAVTRTVGDTATVRFSGDLGATWATVANPCTGHGKTAPVYALVDQNTHRFICGDGTVLGFKGSNPKPTLTHKFTLTSTTGKAVHANSVATNDNGTVVGYTGAGLWAYVSNETTKRELTGDVGYVGLTSASQGIALPATPGPSYWFTRDGGLSWISKSWG